MPKSKSRIKPKTNSSTKKRCSLTASGAVRITQAGRRHLMLHKKGKKGLHHKRGTVVVQGRFFNKLKKYTNI